MSLLSRFCALSLLYLTGCSLLFGVSSRGDCREEESEDTCEGDSLLVCRGNDSFLITCDDSCDPNNNVCVVCGDGFLSNGEDCDDDNTQGGDGCRSNCTIEVCGDSIVDLGEECDDGDQINDNECSNACSTPRCGDGILQESELCDDNNQADNDGCRNDCTPPVCGDGVLAIVEACDDGNTQDNDCCSNACFLLSEICELEPNDTPQSTDDFFALAPNSFRQAFLSTNGDIDIFTLSFAGDVSLSAQFCPFVAGQISANPEISLTIRNSSGDLIAQDISSSFGPCLRLLDEPLPAGDYLVEISASPFTINPPEEPGASYFLAITACGNGVAQPAVNGLPGELCDDGNTTSGDGCRNDCRGVEVCGDSFIDLLAGEECDDIGFGGGDGCVGCQLEPGFVAEVEPNDSLGQANSLGSVGAVGSGFEVDFFRVQLTGTASIRATLSTPTGFTCSPQTLGSDLVLLNPQGLPIAQELGGKDFGQVCNLIDPEEKHAARALPAGDYFIQVFFPIAYSLQVEVFPCGDNILQPGEECEPPGSAGCDLGCQRIPTCGDGFRDAPETCDDSDQTSGDGCDQSCQKETSLEVEPNDDGAVEVGGAAPFGNDFSEANAQAGFNEDAVIVGAISPAGDEDVFRVLGPGFGSTALRIDIFDATLGVGQPCGPNLDTFLAIRSVGASGPSILSNDRGRNDFCSGVTLFGDSEFPSAFLVHIFAPSDNQELPPYLLVLDYIECGDGILDFGEECDPPGTDCDIICQNGPVCGDGVREGFELCDDGNTANSDGCSSSCQIEFLAEFEPNEDGSVSVGGDPLNGNDFSTLHAGAPTVAQISTDITVQAAIAPAGDEDVFAIQNPTASAVLVRLDTFDQSFGAGFCPPTAANTVLSIRDETGALLAQNDDRTDIMGSEPCSGLNVLLNPGQTAFAHVTAFGDALFIQGYLLVINFP